MPATVTPLVADLSKTPRVERHKFRGHVYEFHELTITELDAIVKRATVTKTDPDGRSYEAVDASLQMKYMIETSAGVPLREQTALGARLVGGLSRVVNEMHFGEEPDELTDEERAGEGNA